MTSLKARNPCWHTEQLEDSGHWASNIWIHPKRHTMSSPPQQTQKKANRTIVDSAACVLTYNFMTMNKTWRASQKASISLSQLSELLLLIVLKRCLLGLSLAQQIRSTSGSSAGTSGVNKPWQTRDTTQGWRISNSVYSTLLRSTNPFAALDARQSPQ